MTDLLLVIEGTPVAQPRHRVAVRGGFAKAYLPSDHPVHAFKKKIAITALAARPNLVGAIGIAIRFFLPIQKARLKRWERDAPGIRDGERRKRPDVDNVAKAVLDALTGIAFEDDSCVVDLHVTKDCSPEPRTEIRVWSVVGGL